jgi:hypothetical protein
VVGYSHLVAADGGADIVAVGKGGSWNMSN